VSKEVLAPLAGKVVPLSEVPDPVFAEQMVGAGLAIEPTESMLVEVFAPVSGKIVKLHAHAFVVVRGDGVGILVHLGIDTVKLKGAGFTIHAVEGTEVQAGERIVSFDPEAVRAQGLSASCPIVVLDSPTDSVASLRVGRDVGVGDVLFAY
jgi:PTS system glucose-specific IIA component/PTS system N-acetylglucosamine-specific IIA component